MSKPPDVIRTLKDYLWYLRANEFYIPVPRGDEFLWLGSLDPEAWAETVSRWILHHQIPAALEPLDEAEQAAIRQIDRGSPHRCGDDGSGFGDDGGYPGDGGDCGPAGVAHLRRDPPDFRSPPDVS